MKTQKELKTITQFVKTLAVLVLSMATVVTASGQSNSGIFQEPSAVAGILQGVQNGLVSTDSLAICPHCPPLNPLAGLPSPQTLLIIAPDQFLPVVQPLANHKNSTGMPTVVVSISSLTRFFGGSDDPEKVKRGIQYAHENLSTKYVMLVGDAHWFPVRYEFWHGLSGCTGCSDGDYMPSDLYYANLYHHALVPIVPGVLVAFPIAFDNWDANGNHMYNEDFWEANAPNADNVDGYPDVAVARVPAHSAADVTTYVNKVIAYESQPSIGDQFTFLADAGYGGSTSMSDSIVTNSGLTAPAFHTVVSWEPQPYQPNWVNEVLPSNLPAVVGQIATSTWVSYVGHGSRWTWDAGSNGNSATPNGLDPSLMDWSQLKYNTRPPVVFAAGCWTGVYAPEAPGISAYSYQDVSSQRHTFVAWTSRFFGQLVTDNVTGQTWGHCPRCQPFPITTPTPNPYDFDESDLGFSYPWLIQDPNGGAIAYFGEVSVAPDSMGVELETHMLADYQRGDRVLGSIWLAGAQAYFWNNYTLNNGIPPGYPYQQPPRVYLGWMEFFGDPSLRLH